MLEKGHGYGPNGNHAFFYSKFTLKQPPFFGRICMKQEEEGSDETQQMMLTKVTNLK